MMLSNGHHFSAKRGEARLPTLRVFNRSDVNISSSNSDIDQIERRQYASSSTFGRASDC